MSRGPDIETIRHAHRRISEHIHRTPVMTCATLDAMAGANLFFKCENLQKTGSFKMRGASNAVFSLSPAEAKQGVVTHSSGNHAAALSLAARKRGIPAYIVMPSNSPVIKQRAVEGYGGKITLCEPTLLARDEAARVLIEKTGAAMIHPYNDSRIIAGQGTAAAEFLDQVPDLDFILAPVSGGGLLSGTAIAAKSMMPAMHVIGCEPHGADDAARSMISGKLEPCDHPDTIADGLRATLSEMTFAILRERVDKVVTVTEAEIISAMRDVWERMKLIIEPSSAVTVAPALLRRIGAEGKRVGIILSGGNVDLENLPFRLKG